MVTQYRPLEKKQAKSLKLNVDLLFSWFFEHNKLYPKFLRFKLYKKSLHITAIFKKCQQTQLKMK